jgi:hypothetical protein
MVDDEAFHEVLAESREFESRESYTPEEYARLKRAVFSDPFRQILRADRTYFVLGKYDGAGRERRLELVKSTLNEREGAFAYLMKDVPDAWEFWPTKFRILAQRATRIVPVLEDTEGSHDWEFGVVSGPEFRPKVFVLKREYGSEEVEREKFHALPAEFVEVLDRDGRVARWRDEEELEKGVEEVP